MCGDGRQPFVIEVMLLEVSQLELFQCFTCVQANADL